MKTLDEYIDYLDCTIRMHDDLLADIKAEATRKGLKTQNDENIQLREWLMDYKRLKAQQELDLVSRKTVLDIIDVESWSYCDYLVHKHQGGSPDAEAVSHFADNLRERFGEVNA